MVHGNEKQKNTAISSIFFNKQVKPYEVQLKRQRREN